LRSRPARPSESRAAAPHDDRSAEKSARRRCRRARHCRRHRRAARLRGGSDDPPLHPKPYDHLQAISDCLDDPEIAASLRGEHDYRPKEDIVLALQRDLFDFVMVGRLEDGHVRVTRQDVR